MIKLQQQSPILLTQQSPVLLGDLGSAPETASYIVDIRIDGPGMDMVVFEDVEPGFEVTDADGLLSGYTYQWWIRLDRGAWEDQGAFTMEGEPAPTPLLSATLLEAAPSSTFATLRSEVTTFENISDGAVYFQYRAVGATEWIDTASQSVTSTGKYSQGITGLTPETNYENRAIFTGGGLTETTDPLTFTTQAATTPGDGIAGPVRRGPLSRTASTTLSSTLT